MPEPPWQPDLRVYVSDPAGARFVDESDNAIVCEDPRMSEFALISYQKIEDLKAKLQRCEKWK